MKNFVLVSAALFCFGCASKSSVSKETNPRVPASAVQSNLELLKEALMVAKSDCKIEIQENSSDIKGNPAFVKFPALSVTVTPPQGSVQNFVIVGEPVAYMTRYYSKTSQAYIYSTAFDAKLLDSDFPMNPNKLEIVTKEGRVSSMSFFKVRSSLNGQGPTYDNGYSACKFQ